MACRIEELSDCATAGQSLKLGKASYVSTKKRKNNPAGCFFDGKNLKFNPKWDSKVFINPSAKQYLVCDNCGHVPAPAPRIKTTKKVTRGPDTTQTRPKQKSPAPSKRVETTPAMRGPKPFQILETCSTKKKLLAYNTVMLVFASFGPKVNAKRRLSSWHSRRKQRSRSRRRDRLADAASPLAKLSFGPLHRWWYVFTLRVCHYVFGSGKISAWCRNSVILSYRHMVRCR